MAELLPTDRWTRVEAVFMAAIELPREAQPAFVERECADEPPVRAHVLSLLGYDADQSLCLVETLDALGVVAASLVADRALEGARLGPYRVEREIGRGGSSIVYLGARADGAFEKQVAIKLIRRGMHTGAVTARLGRERRILAALDHPWIARLLDGGTTDEGEPWIAMEYVRGLPLHRFCDEHAVSLEARVDLVARIADAVGYAHRHLVVHGDLKPGNILVDEQGDPKLLDFGIARLLAPDTAEAAPNAEPAAASASRAFTPGYASPEQVTGGVIGTASDVYSLGVVAFELLTGVRPSDEAERPSAAALRAGRGRRWARRLRGDLDAILMTALRQRPEHRYHTVDQFGGDLGRHLAGVPVSARGDALVYRAGKFVGRHRIAVPAAAIVAVVAAVGAGLYIHEVRLAAHRFDELHHLANSFVFDVDDELRDLPNATHARAVIVGQAIAYLNGLALEARGDRQLQRETGNAWRRVGDVQGDPEGSSLGDIAGARDSYTRSIAALEPLARAETGPRRRGDVRADLVDSYAKLATLERVTGNSGRAAALTDAALGLARQIGSPPDVDLEAQLGEVLVGASRVTDLRGSEEDATRQASQAVALLEHAALVNPLYRVNLADALSVLAGREWRMRDAAASIAHYRRNLALRQQLAAASPADRMAERDLLLAWGHLGDVFVDRTSAATFQPAAAIDGYREALAVARAMAASDASDRTAQTDLAICFQRVGDGLAAGGRFAAAVASYQQARDQLERLAAASPNNTNLSYYLADTTGQIGSMELQLNDAAAARAPLERSVRVLSALLAHDPGNNSFGFLHLVRVRQLCSALVRLHDARALFAALADLKASAASAPSSTSRMRLVEIPKAWEAAGDADVSLHDHAAARVSYARSLDGWRELEPWSPEESALRAGVEAKLTAERAR